MTKFYESDSDEQPMHGDMMDVDSPMPALLHHEEDEVDAPQDRVIKRVPVSLTLTPTTTTAPDTSSPSHSHSPLHPLSLLLFPANHPILPERDDADDSTPSSSSAPPLTCRRKVQANMWEISVALDPTSTHYHSQHGETFGEALASHSTSSSSLPPYLKHQADSYRERHHRMTSFTYRSSSSSSQTLSYFAGTFHEGTLHLAPITHLLLMRPDLRHLDSLDAQHRAATSALVQASNAMEVEEGTRVQEAARLVHVSVTGGVTAAAAADESGKRGGVERQAQMELQRQQEDEAWREVVVCRVGSREVDEVVERWVRSRRSDKVEEKIEGGGFGSNGEGSLSLPFSSAMGDFVQSLNPNVSALAKQQPVHVKRGMSAYERASLSLSDQVLALLLNSHLLTLTNVQEALSLSSTTSSSSSLSHSSPSSPPTPTQALLVTHLTQHAHLIHGTWVLKSAYLYTQRPMHARNILLATLLEEGCVEGARWHDEARMEVGMEKAMLREVGVLVERRGGKGSGRRGKGKEGRGIEDGVGRVWVLKARGEEEDKEEEHLCPAEEAVRQEQESALKELGRLSREWLHSMHSTTGSQLKTKPTKAPTMQVDASGKLVLSTSSTGKSPASRGGVLLPPGKFPVVGNSIPEQMEALILQLFARHSILSLDFIMGCLLHRASEKDLAGNVLSVVNVQREVVYQCVNKLAYEVQSLFILKSVQNDTDTYRVPIIKRLQQSNTLKKADAHSAWTTAGLAVPSVSMYSKIMKELCISTGTTWVMKPSPSLDDLNV